MELDKFLKSRGTGFLTKSLSQKNYRPKSAFQIKRKAELYKKLNRKT